MTVRPIIFSGPMVRALLDGTKTQTRRLATSPLRRAQVGDRLYVRERVTRFDKGTCDQWIWYQAGANDLRGWIGREFPSLDPNAPWPNPEGPAGGAPYAVPSIHMPRWASRLTLTVTDVRFHPLQDITDEDALAEGALHPSLGDEVWVGWLGFPRKTCPPRTAFAMLWEGLHDKDGQRWGNNPQIVALTFTVERRNIDDEAGYARDDKP